MIYKFDNEKQIVYEHGVSIGGYPTFGITPDDTYHQKVMKVMTLYIL